MLLKRNIDSFSEFAMRLSDLNLLPYQSYAFINPNGEFIGDSLGVFERLYQYCSYLKSSIGLDFNLQHLNKNLENKDLVLSDSDKKLIEKLWSYDFEFFCDFTVDCYGQALLKKIEPKAVPTEILKGYDCWQFLGDTKRRGGKVNDFMRT
ncbi:hypothetical protein [Acaryochloris marina]|uniref:Uncharacterized protein n=1 Tax=Acaryochloris marina (strain MBIC 11017) TaxID=329726 RepID=B0C9Y7_ACAM1|nr:hypothetical protein [Acaryochloris marina]ABW25427.1 hypothetical protein AM1_0368 [Acaryochloris marina MBIC11017]